MSLKKNTIWSLVGAGLPMLVGAFAVPYILRNIGVESFGVLTLIWSLIGYFSFFDFGLGRALTHQVAIAISNAETSQIIALVRKGLIITLITGFIGTIVLIGLANLIVKNCLDVSKNIEKTTYYVILIAAIGIPLTTVSTGLRGVLEAYGDFKNSNLIRIYLGVASFLLPVVSIYTINNSLIWIVWSLILARVFSFFGYSWFVTKHLKNQKKNQKNELDSISANKLMGFGTWMTVSNIIGPIMVTADRYIISGLLGASVVAYYTVPMEITSRILIISGALSAVLFPEFSKKVTDNSNYKNEIYNKAIKKLLIILLPICLALALLSKKGLLIWLGKDFSNNSWLITCILSLGVFFNGIASVPFAYIQGLGKARLTAIVHIAELFFYIPLLFVLVYKIKLVGAAIAWTSRTIIDFCILVYLKNSLLKKLN